MMYEDLIKQLQPPIYLVGDFNIRHPMWRDTSTSSNANIVIELITKHNLGCMNSGAPTHYHQVVNLLHTLTFLCVLIQSHNF